HEARTRENPAGSEALGFADELLRLGVLDPLGRARLDFHALVVAVRDADANGISFRRNRDERFVLPAEGAGLAGFEPDEQERRVPLRGLGPGHYERFVRLGAAGACDDFEEDER